MNLSEVISRLRYKAENIKAHLEPEYFSECADYLERYAWHDLRKNPEDLPENWEGVMLYTSYRDYEIGYVVNCECSRLKGWYIEYDDEFQYCDIGSNYVIAWRYIEPFEEADE